MYRLCRLLVAGILVYASVGAGLAEADQCFVAEQDCPMMASIRKQTNPGSVMAEIGKSYPFLSGNKEPPTHYQVRVEGAEPIGRWVAVECGTVAACGDSPKPAGSGPVRARGQDYLLAISWQPAFCEGRANRPECDSQSGRYDATHFSLHGLWPQPRSNVYCGVSAQIRRLDETKQWDKLPEPTLTPETKSALDKVMPGTQSNLHRHEWIKHGTCYSRDAEEYFSESIALLKQINAREPQSLFERSIDRELSIAQVRAAFDQGFGRGAGTKVAMDCSRAGGRELIGELWVNLRGEITATTAIGDLIAAAPAAGTDCQGGEVDRAGQ